jgi:DNA (cytosine-5)-methyltransferase 1
MYRPSAKGYFSGAGLMEIGLMQAGVEFVQSLDLDKHSTQAMKMNPHYFKHKVLLKDIKDVLVLEQEKTDIIIGTYPCNHYSPIADLFDSRTGDDLFLHFFRHIAIEQPPMYVVENVPGMKKFKVVMEAMTQLPGYYVNIFCPLDAANWLPQKRERLILIGTKTPFNISAPGKASRIPSIKDILEPDAQIEVNDTVVARIKGVYRDKPIVVDPDDPQDIAPTCVAHYAKDMGTRLVKDPRYPYGLRPFTIREYARLQGVPDDYQFSDNRYSYKLIGNGVPVPMGRWIGEQAMKYFNK